VATLEKTTLPTDIYWATEEDPRLLIDYCREKIRAWQDYLKRSRLLRRVWRSWRYYHGLFFSGSDSDNCAIKILGEQGELAGLAINEFRSHARQMLSLVTSNRLAWNSVARNSEQKSLQQARLGNDTLDYYADRKRVEDRFVTAAEHGLIFCQGFCYTTWDPLAGEDFIADPMTGEVMRTGDLRYGNPSIFDVAFELRRQSFEDHSWCLVRTWENRWDLAAHYPDMAEEILRVGDDDDSDEEAFGRIDDPDSESDLIPVWCLHHLTTDGCPEGRYFRFTRDVPLEPAGPDHYGFLPLDRCAPEETLLTTFGYSPLLDLQGINEAINGTASTILSNQRTFGRQVVVCPSGMKLSPVHLEGFTFLEIPRDAPFPPQGVNLTNSPAEMFKFKDGLRVDGEYTTGINATARGQPASKESSGSALALIDAKAVQAVNTFARSYSNMVASVGSKTLKILNKFLPTAKKIAIAGKHKRNYQISVEKGSFSEIDRVEVKASSAYLQTESGKRDMVELLLNARGMDGKPTLKTPEEIITFIETGEHEPLVEADMAQLNAIREENENLMEPGGRAHALITDDHSLHIREHQALLNTTEARENQELSSRVEAHVMEHIMLLLPPDPVRRMLTQYLQAILGHTLPPPPPLPGVMAPPGPGQPGQPREVPVGKPQQPEVPQKSPAGLATGAQPARMPAKPAGSSPTNEAGPRAGGSPIAA
jgi:hypothetical protein